MRLKFQADVLEQKWAVEKRPQRTQMEKNRRNAVKPLVHPGIIGERRAKTPNSPTRRLDGHSGSLPLDAEGDIRGTAQPTIQKPEQCVAPQAVLHMPFGPSNSRVEQPSAMYTKVSNRMSHERQGTRVSQDTVRGSQKAPPQSHHATDTAHRLRRRSPPPPAQNRTAPEPYSFSPEPGDKPTRRLFKSPIVLVPRADSERRREGRSQDDGGRNVR